MEYKPKCPEENALVAKAIALGWIVVGIQFCGLITTAACFASLITALFFHVSWTYLPISLGADLILFIFYRIFQRATDIAMSQLLDLIRKEFESKEKAE